MGGYIGNQVTAQSADSTIYLPVRQTVLTGSSSAGVPNFMSAGTGLRVSLSAATTPMAIAFARGFGAYGAQDYVSRISANNSDMTGADLNASNTNFIFANYTTNSTVTWDKTLLPPQYGPTYAQNKQALLRFAGADASTSIIDDYGNTWAVAGNAQVDTAVQIDTLNTLLLDGAGDYVTSSSFTSFGDGSWTMECKVRWNTLPAASNQCIFSCYNGVVAVINLTLNDTAGTKKLSFFASSNGSTQDIANGSLGTSTVWATGTTYHVAVTFDALAGKYFVYKDGVLDLTVVSTAKACSFTTMRLGDNGAGANQLNGAVAGFRVSPCCRYPNGSTFTAPTISTFAVEGHWFDNVGYQMWEATTASAVAGTNPTFTQRYRVFVGEADTSGAAVVTVRNYAYQGRYVSADTTLPGVGVRTAFQANLGVVPTSEPILYLRNTTAESGFTSGMVYRTSISTTAGPIVVPAIVAIEDRNTLSFVTGANTAFSAANRTTGTLFTPVTANNKMFVVATRGW